MVMAFLLVSMSNVRNTNSDPRSSLLVSEAILQHGTLKLDHYGTEVMKHYGETVHEKNGHFYTYFPLGTSIASLPFVAMANGWGLNMIESQSATQIMIASVTAVLTIYLLIKLAQAFLPPYSAVLAGALFWFGSSFSSTAGTALWSHNFAALFALVAIYCLVQTARCGRTGLWPLIALSLFMAYLCRPTLALLAPFALLFLFTYHRTTAILCAALLALLLLGFAGFSMHEWGQYLPDYYLPKRLSGEHFGTALYGNLLSPARGLLVYSPFILLAWLCYRASDDRLGLKRSWLLIGLAWPLAHWVAVSRFPVWAGGWSYGPRFMTDILPGLFLLTLRAWPVSLPTRRLRIGASVLAACAFFSVYVNAYQGLFNVYTARWNMQPDTGMHPEYLFDWRYPQFLHNKTNHESRIADANQSLGYLPLSFDASWKKHEDVGMSAPYAMVSAISGAKFTFTTSGCFELRALKHGWSGIMKVVRDGVAIREIDLYSKETNRTFAEVFDEKGSHDYTVEVTGNKNTDSGGYEVWIDGVRSLAACPHPHAGA